MSDLNFKSVTEVPTTETTEGLNLLANNNGIAVQIEPGKIGAQADWNETDENSPAFVKNKPETRSVTIFTYNADLDCFYLMNETESEENVNNGERPVSTYTAVSPEEPNGTKLTYDMLDEAMKKGGVLCDMSGYKMSSSSALSSVPSPGELSVYAPVMSYAKMSHGTSDSPVQALNTAVEGESYTWGFCVCYMGEMLSFSYEVYPGSDK